MTKLNAILVGGLTAATQIAHGENEAIFQLKDLKQIGLNPNVIQQAYRKQVNIELDWNEIVKVSGDEEGKNINFNTLNGISVTVPIQEASGPFNKGDTYVD